MFEKKDLAASRNTVEAASSSHFAAINRPSRMHVLGNRMVLPFSLRGKNELLIKIKGRKAFSYSRIFIFDLLGVDSSKKGKESFTLNGISWSIDVVELF